MTVARRFAGITPELVENVRTGARVEGWSASFYAAGGGIGAKPEHAGVWGPTPLNTSARAAVLEPRNGYGLRESAIPNRRGDVLPGAAK